MARTSTTPSAPKPNAATLGNTKTLDERLGYRPRQHRRPRQPHPRLPHQPTHRPHQRSHRPARAPTPRSEATRGPASGVDLPRAPPSPAPATMPEPPAAQRSGGWRTPPAVTAETIRDWVGRPDLKVTVKPVIDLAEHVSVEAYEVPDRIAEPAALRDISCVFPWCTRPARRRRPDQHPATTTTPPPTTRADPPAPARSPPCADDTIGCKPTPAAGPTTPSNPAPTCGPAPTATTTSAYHTTSPPMTETPPPTTHRPHPATPATRATTGQTRPPRPTARRTPRSVLRHARG